MAKYWLTMERTLRISVEFEAQDDEEAEQIAADINMKTGLEDFYCGNVETDYSLSDDAGRTILDWD